MLLGDPDVGGRGNFQPAAQRVAVENGNDGLAQPCDRGEGIMSFPDPEPAEIQRLFRAQGVDVPARRKGFFARARYNDRPNVGVMLDFTPEAVQGTDHAIIQRIQLVGPVDRDDRNMAVDVQLQARVGGVGHNFTIRLPGRIFPAGTDCLP